MQRPTSRWLCVVFRKTGAFTGRARVQQRGIAMMGDCSGGCRGRLVSGKADTVIVLENDLFRRTSRAAAEEILAKAAQVIVIDHLKTATAGRAGVVLPAGTFAESTGTYVSSEGRAQRLPGMPPREGLLDGWKWISELAGSPRRAERSEPE